MGASRLENKSPPQNSQNMSHKPQRENTHEHLHAHQNLFPTARADRSIRQTKGEKKGRESIKVSMGSPKTKRLDNITAELNTPGPNFSRVSNDHPSSSTGQTASTVTQPAFSPVARSFRDGQSAGFESVETRSIKTLDLS